MAGYQTGRLEQYPVNFQRVASKLFHLLRGSIRAAQLKKFKGSYSIFGSTSKGTAAKIVIYHPEIGKSTRQWTHIRDGVYVLIRANGALAGNIWGNILNQASPQAFSRMWRTDTIAVFPRHGERFAYFPIVAGDDLGEIANLITACSQA